MIRFRGAAKRRQEWALRVSLKALRAYRALKRQRRWPARQKRRTPSLDLQSIDSEEALRKFRFTVPEIRSLCVLLRIPSPFPAGSLRVDSAIALALLLNRLSGTRALHDIASYFGLHETYVCKVIRALALHLLEQWEKIINFNLARMKRHAPRYAAVGGCSHLPMRCCHPPQSCWGRHLVLSRH
jgi:hypothetical protein